MRNALIVLSFVLASLPCLSQEDSLAPMPDDTFLVRMEYPTGFFNARPEPHKGRIIGVSASIGTIWSASMIGLQTVWYKDTLPNTFKVIDDSKSWLQMDKAGHVYTAYQLNRLTTDLYLWTGVNNKTATWIGFGVSTGYQTTLEVLDGFSGNWGWSWGDIAANTAGSALYTIQQLTWKEQRILPKFSYSPSPFAALRPQVLGSTFPESLLKDYNGQTYWLSVAPGRFFESKYLPKWACLSFGYSAHEKLVGSESMYIDPITGITYREQREFLFSFDIDFSQLNIRRPWLRTLVKQFNYLKIPFPTIVLRDGKILGRPFYF